MSGTCPLIHSIADAIDIAAKEKIRLRLAGTPCDDNFDLLIACTAIANDMICVTDNTKDFHSASAPLNSFSSKRLAVSWKKLKFAGKKEVTE